MNNKIDALMAFALAETPEARDEARAAIRMLTQPTEAAPAGAVDIHAMVDGILAEIGVPCHIKGHRYLISAIECAVQNPAVIDAITKELYPCIAKKHDTTPSRVERAIRHAIEVAWDRGDLDTLQRYFGNTISISKGKPTNSEFIARMSNLVRQRLGIAE